MKETESPGMNNQTYFLDTYAIFEIIEANPKYEKYTKCKFITTILNLAELNYNLKKDMTKEKANSYTKDYFDFTVEIEPNDIIKAMDLKTKQRKLSIPDAIGYIIAKKYGIKFLTGDSDFENLENVEYIKK